MNLDKRKLLNDVCLGNSPNSPFQFRGQRDPIELSVAWPIESPEEADAILGNSRYGYAYRRDHHPNADSLAEPLRQLHEAEAVLLTAQGQSALTALAVTLLSPGAKVLIGEPIYGGTSTLLSSSFGAWGLDCRSIPIGCRESWEKAMSPSPTMVIVETIANPTMRVADIEWLAQLCKRHGCLLVVDNTFATPLLCQPLRLGADIVIESLTKLVGGHSDAMLGLIACQAELAERLRPILSNLGLTAQPLDCWLTRRGLATLPLRLDRACQNAMRLAEACENHSQIAKVDYPGLASHADSPLAARLFGDRFGHMLAIHFDGGVDRVEAVMRRLQPRVPFCATLGDVVTTVSHPTSTSHRKATPAQLRAIGVSDGTLRVSCGIEDTDALVAHFLEAIG